MGKIKHCRKRGNSYQIRIPCGKDPQGRQIMKTMTWTPEPGMTSKQIENELQRQVVLFEEQCRKEQQKNSYEISADIKFQDFAELWCEEYAKLNLRNSSYERIKHLTPRVYAAIGNKSLSKITSRNIQLFVNDLVLNGKNKRTGKPLSRKTAVHHLSLISSIFTYAVKQEIVSDNPCCRVTVPKGKGGKNEKEIYTLEEVEQIVTCLEDEPLMYKAFFTLEFYSGFRRSEILGLEWKDVDWKNSVISVRRTSNYTPSEGLYTDTTKTEKSQRSLKFPDEIMGLLRQLKNKQNEDREKYGSKWVESDRLFIKWNGEPLFVSQPYGWFKRFCKRHELRFCDIHSLRHFYASALISEGVDAATVSNALGHSTITTTTNIYCHAFQQAQARAGDAIASVLNFRKKA